MVDTTSRRLNFPIKKASMSSTDYSGDQLFQIPQGLSVSTVQIDSQATMCAEGKGERRDCQGLFSGLFSGYFHSSLNLGAPCPCKLFSETSMAPTILSSPLNPRLTLFRIHLIMRKAVFVLSRSKASGSNLPPTQSR